MTDIALVIVAEGDFAADLDLLGADLATDQGLDTACLVSLFSDRLAAPDDVLPTGADRRGWWGDAYADVDGDLIGSRLWLLARAKQVPQTLVDAQAYAEEALAWMIEDGVAAAVSCPASFPQTGWLEIDPLITRPNGDQIRFAYVWNNA
jgi:phage gp46-like protein